jgi:membrane protease YdiL (CAAX protease family)
VIVFLLSVGGLPGKNPDMSKVFQVIRPRGPLELATWILLPISAGFCEEFVFLGYLRKQFFAPTGSIARCHRRTGLVLPTCTKVSEAC